MGGVRHGHPGGRGGWGHHAAGHAAQQPAAHLHGRRAADQAEGRRRALPRRRRVLGRCHPGQRRRPARPARRGRLRVQVLPGAVRCGRVPAAVGRRARALPRRARRVRRHDDRACRGRRRAGARARRERAGATPISSRPARAASRTSRSRSSSRPPGTPAPRCTCCTCPARTPRRWCARPVATGSRITVETCPHYLVFEAQSIADGATQFKCCPPIREADNREDLWTALGRGDIDCIVSDHSPCVPELKGLEHGDFGTAWGGISSLQIGLPAVWTEARRRGARPRRRRALDGATPRRDRGPRPQGPDRAPAATPTSSRSRRMRRSSSIRGGCSTATRSPLTPTAPSRAWCGAPGCAARSSPTASRVAV